MADAFARRYELLRHRVDSRMARLATRCGSGDIGSACRYVLTGGGKRVRSVLLLLSCEAVGGNANDALHAAVAVEIMHNFTLVHDDIMDNAASRRNRPTVHTRWDANTALLAGDVLLGMAYESLLQRDHPALGRIAALFTTAYLTVCEGQALDMEFERRANVSVKEYFGMIQKKTARLLSLACELGGIYGGGNGRQIRALRTFGHHLGRAFQVQDDLLDVVADERRLGKTTAADIIAGKKTFLLMTTLERSSGRDRRRLRHLLNADAATRKGAVREIVAMYQRHGALDAAAAQVQRDTARATVALRSLPPGNATRMLHWMSATLLRRRS